MLVNKKGEIMTRKHRRILVVDDEPYLLEMLDSALSEEGYDVDTADNADRALTLFEECRPDLVLLDIRMPGINGYGVLDKIRQLSNVPIIMLTAVQETSSVIKSLGILGADDYVRKPFSIDILLARIKAKLRRANEKTDMWL